MGFLLKGTATGLGDVKSFSLKLTVNKDTKCSFNSLLMVSGHSVMTPNPGVTQMTCCCHLADITGKDGGKWSHFASTFPAGRSVGGLTESSEAEDLK